MVSHLFRQDVFLTKRFYLGIHGVYIIIRTNDRADKASDSVDKCLKINAVPVDCELNNTQ